MLHCNRGSVVKAAVLAIALITVLIGQSSAQEAVCDETRVLGKFTLTFDGVDYDIVAGTSTWNYTLDWIEDVDPPIEPVHVIIGVCGELSASDFHSFYPPGGAIVDDPATGIYGVKWDPLAGPPPEQLSFTVSGFYGVTAVQFAVGEGSEDDRSTICGMSCTEICVVEITCPPDITVDCSEGTDPSVTGQPTAIGSCPRFNFTHSDEVTPGSCGGEYSIARTWVVTDASGTTDSCEQTITVLDNTAPQIACPETLRVECPTDVPAASPGNVEAYDSCSEVTVTYVGDETLGESCDMEIRRTYRATDECGNFAECVQVILVEDTTPPVITCPQQMQVICIGDVPAPSPGTVEAEDNCGSVTVVHVGDEVEGEGCPKTITRTYRATDECGNSSECEQIIVVTDSRPPDIKSCPDTTWVECIGDVPGPDPSLVRAKDNCPNVTVRHVEDVYEGTCPTVISRLYEAVDECGNAAECVHIIMVDDTTPPVITCPGDLTFECDAVGAFGEATATDNCGTVANLSYVDDESQGQCELDRIIRRTWTAVDECGNSSSCVQTITIVDTTPPVITCPDDLTLECDEVQEPVDFGQAGAVDACDPSPVLSYADVETPGSCPQNLTILRTWTATDACGNSSSCLQTITIEDTTPPQITCPSDTLKVPCGEGVPEPDTSLVEATDNCGEVTITYVGDTPVNGPMVLAVGGQLIARTYRATDECDNSSECVQMILLEDDTTPPVIECEGLTVTVECGEGIPVPSPPTVWDDCDPSPTVTSETVETPGECPTIKTVQYVYTATDAAGNSSTAVCGVVTVQDTTPPMVLCPDTMWVGCGSAIPEPVTGEIYAEDVCGSAIVAHAGDESGGNIPENQVFRTYVATDECGNSSECVQVIVVSEDTEAPVIDCQLIEIAAQCDGEFTVPDPPDVWDDCDPEPDVEVITKEIIGDCPHDWELTKTLVATDAAGNQDSCVYFHVTVKDTTAPVITCPEDVTVECDSVSVVDGYGTATAVDNCDPSPIVASVDSMIQGQCPQEMTIERTWTATDVCGNSSSCVQLIHIVDTTPPEITTCPPGLEFDSPNDVVYPDNSWTGFENGGGVADDNCDDQLDAGYTIGDPQGECPTIVVLTWTVTDDCGNAATCDQTVTINCEGELCARWTGGGRIGTGAIIPEGASVSHSFEFRCSLRKPDNLQVNWDGSSFHMMELESVYCVMNPDLPPGTKGAPVNEVFGSGTGRYNKDRNYTVDFHFTDVGERGVNDYGSITITSPDGDVILQIEGTLTFGNHQAHKDHCRTETEPETAGDVGGGSGQVGPDGDLTPNAERIPSNFTVLQGVPNPFSHTVKIGYGIPKAGVVRVEVFDVAGRRLATLLDKEQTPGFHSVMWDGKNAQGVKVAPGVYFYRAQFNNKALIRKMILLQ